MQHDLSICCALTDTYVSSAIHHAIKLVKLLQNLVISRCPSCNLKLDISLRDCYLSNAQGSRANGVVKVGLLAQFLCGIRYIAIRDTADTTILSSCLIFKSNHCNPTEDRVSSNLICVHPIFRRVAVIAEWESTRIISIGHPATCPTIYGKVHVNVIRDKKDASSSGDKFWKNR